MSGTQRRGGWAVDLSMQRPEGALISATLRANPATTSAAAAAAQAGIGVTRWRTIISGSKSEAGRRVPVIAPALTLARIAEALGITGDQLAAAGREDAAGMLSEIQHARLTPLSTPTPAQRAVLAALHDAGVREPGEQLEALAALVADLAVQVRVRARALRR